MFLYRVQPSPISGVGTFSLRAFHAGELMPRTRDYNQDYTKVLANRVINIDANSETHGFNHSCDPNVDLRMGEADGYLALKEIHPGDELTVNYYRQGERSLPIGFAGCNCQVCRNL